MFRCGTKCHKNCPMQFLVASTKEPIGCNHRLSSHYGIIKVGLAPQPRTVAIAECYMLCVPTSNKSTQTYDWLVSFALASISLVKILIERHQYVFW